MADQLYDDLTKHWPQDETFSRSVGGMNLTYVTGEQVTSRLNEVLGVLGWSFKVLEHGVNAEADEVWVLGEVQATYGVDAVTRQQFGSQKIKRRRDTGVPLDLGFDLKGATTDALKKCASLLGVGLYLSERSSRVDSGVGDGGSTYSLPSTPVHQNGAMTGPSSNGGGGGAEPVFCMSCQTEIQPIQFASGDFWSPQKMAQQSRGKYGRVLCMECYKQAKHTTAREEAQPVLQDTGVW